MVDESVRQFIIDQTGGDHTVELYDQWCDVADAMQYDHMSANAFVMSALENSDPGVILEKIMSGFAVAAHTQAANAGIMLNPDLSYHQLLMWVKTMITISEQEDYSDIKDMLYSDMTDRDKIQKVFEIIGPGVDPKYENMVFSVESGTIDGFKQTIEEVQQDPSVKDQRQSDIQAKIKEYNKLKEIVDGVLYSDRYSSMPSCYNMDIDNYLTPMKENIDFYSQPDNWNEFFIDVWGCLILSNVAKEQYVDTMTAAVYEFFDSEAVRPKVLIEMNKAIARLSV